MFGQKRAARLVFSMNGLQCAHSKNKFQFVPVLLFLGGAAYAKSRERLSANAGISLRKKWPLSPAKHLSMIDGP
jgi:hypothetical protein